MSVVVPWKHGFSGATSQFGGPPHMVKPGTTVLEMGVDGRFDHVARRYPGHITYPTPGHALQLAVDTPFEPDVIRPFRIQQSPGSREQIQGVVVGNNTNETLEVWYRKTGDTAGQLTKETLKQDPLIEINSHSSLLTWDNATDTLAFSERVPFMQLNGLPARLMDMVSHDDGRTSGAVIYACGYVSSVSGRHVGVTGGVARKVDGAWERVGNSTFNGLVRFLYEFNGKLYCGGDFTKYGVRRCNRLAVWDGIDWDEVGGGIGDGTVYGIIFNEDVSPTSAIVFGTFTQAGSLTGLSHHCWLSRENRLSTAYSAPPITTASAWSGTDGGLTCAVNCTVDGTPAIAFGVLMAGSANHTAVPTFHSAVLGMFVYTTSQQMKLLCSDAGPSNAFSGMDRGFTTTGIAWDAANTNLAVMVEQVGRHFVALIDTALASPYAANYVDYVEFETVSSLGGIYKQTSNWLVSGAALSGTDKLRETTSLTSLTLAGTPTVPTFEVNNRFLTRDDDGVLQSEALASAVITRVWQARGAPTSRILFLNTATASTSKKVYTYSVGLKDPVQLGGDWTAGALTPIDIMTDNDASGTIWLSASDGKIYESLDDGATWPNTVTDAGLPLGMVYVNSNTRLYYVTQSGLVRYIPVVAGSINGQVPVTIGTFLGNSLGHIGYHSEGGTERLIFGVTNNGIVACNLDGSNQRTVYAAPSSTIGGVSAAGGYVVFSRDNEGKFIANIDSTTLAVTNVQKLPHYTTGPSGTSLLVDDNGLIMTLSAGETVTRWIGWPMTTGVLRAIRLIGSTVYVLGDVQSENTSHSSLPDTLFQSGETFDVAARGPYAYLLKSDGNHVILNYNSENATGEKFEVRKFGSGPFDLPPLTAVVNASASDRAIAGQYIFYWRLRDPHRGRFSALSEPSDSVLVTDGDYVTMASDLDLIGLFSDYEYIEGYQTLSSEDDAVPGGGSVYRALIGKPAADGSFTLSFMRDESVNDPVTGLIQGGFGDDQLPQNPERLYDFIREDCADLGPCHAVATYQTMTVALEENRGFLQLRWSPTWRLEPENFPKGNVYNTKIPVSLAKTCRLIEAGDFLFLVGGSKIFRMQKAGEFMSILEIYNGKSMLHRDAVAVVGSAIYIATVDGMIELDSRQSTGGEMPGLTHLFKDRWKGQLRAANDTYSLRMGYDSLMNALYIHHPTLHETAVMWFGTGKVTLLPYHLVERVVELNDWDSETEQRCYFVTNRRSFKTPNWNTSSSVMQTMSGLEWSNAYGNPSPNATVTAVGTQVVFGATGTKLSFNGTPFHDPSFSLTQGDLAPFFIIFLTGERKYEAFKVRYATNEFVVLDGVLDPAPSAGDIVALSPVVLGIVGATLPAPNGSWDIELRKRVNAMNTTLARVSSPVFPNATTPDGTYSHLVYGLMRYANWLTNENRTSDTQELFDLAAQTDVRPGLALRPDKNAAAVGYGGLTLFPVVLSFTSNLPLELSLIKTEGDYIFTDVAGPREED